MARKKTEGKDRFTIIRDTREQLGWKFIATEYCAGMVVDGLPTGDYTLVGFEQKFIIERKGTILELAGNLTDDRFERELERLAKFDHPFILVECNPAEISFFPRYCKLSTEQKRKLRVTAPFLLRRITEVQIQYKIPIIPVGKYGKEWAISLFKRVFEKCQTSPASGSGSNTSLNTPG